MPGNCCLDANRLFEGWVGVCLSKLPGNPAVRGQRTFTLPGPPFRGEPYRFRPDFIVGEQVEGQLQTIVVDSKYKITRDGNPRVDQSDLYQVVGYARFCAKRPDEPGLQEACIAVSGARMPFGDALFQAFNNAWQDRKFQGRHWDWADGFRLTRVEVPLPIPVAQAAPN